MTWDGNINSPHTMQDEYELQQRLGADALTTDEEGRMIPIPDDDRCTGITSVDDGVTRHDGPCPVHRQAAPDLDQCPHCEGVGACWDDQTGQPDEPNGGRMVTCHVCRGEGVVDTSPCIACGAPSYDHDEGCPAAEEVR